jgi:CRP-like cAMP-binding protein
MFAQVRSSATIGLVAPGNRRTQTFKCMEDGEVLVIGYNQIEQLYFQNPSFGFFFLRLITKRLLENQGHHLTTHQRSWTPGKQTVA